MLLGSRRATRTALSKRLLFRPLVERPWIEHARTSLVASFANGVVKDEAAVRAAITSPWSNGQTEGQITRLKLVRRQMYGRGKIDLLQTRLGPGPIKSLTEVKIG